MSENFNKNCYTSRSSGYKYRTLSTNTGERKRRNSKEENTFDRQFKELKREISSRINNQVEQTQRTRESIRDKFEIIDAKINSMLELQDTVISLRHDLHIAEGTLAGILDKVEKIEAFTAGTETHSLQSRKSLVRPALPIFEEREIYETTAS